MPCALVLIYEVLGEAWRELVCSSIGTALTSNMVVCANINSRSMRSKSTVAGKGHANIFFSHFPDFSFS